MVIKLNGAKGVREEGSKETTGAHLVPLCKLDTKYLMYQMSETIVIINKPIVPSRVLLPQTPC